MTDVTVDDCIVWGWLPDTREHCAKCDSARPAGRSYPCPWCEPEATRDAESEA